MQTDIHPNTNKLNVVCTCGNKFNIDSTIDKQEMHVELCFKCHSAYTGKRKIAQAGAIEKFQKKFNAYSKVLDSANKDKQ